MYFYILFFFSLALSFLQLYLFIKIYKTIQFDSLFKSSIKLRLLVKIMNLKLIVLVITLIMNIHSIPVNVDTFSKLSDGFIESNTCILI